ncbi:MAG TPA: GNAT family N-acetyltransferase [Acidimicrobiia bacterium]
MTPTVEIRAAVTDDDYRMVSELFREYLRSLPFEIDFQDVDTDVERPSSYYGPPDGRALLGFVDGRCVGVVGVRRFDATSCELKRMYVQPAQRRSGLGRRLAVAAIAAGRELGYRRMLLDTIADMRAANALYESLGFHDIPAYRHNPLPGDRYLELEL